MSIADTVLVVFLRLRVRLPVPVPVRVPVCALGTHFLSFLSTETEQTGWRMRYRQFQRTCIRVRTCVPACVSARTALVYLVEVQFDESHRNRCDNEM